MAFILLLQEVSVTFLYELYQKCNVTNCFRKNAREHLAKYVEIEVDLPNQTVSSPDKSFHFEIDETWKNKLVNGLDDIAITLQYESLIEKYEKSL